MGSSSCGWQGSFGNTAEPYTIPTNSEVAPTQTLSRGLWSSEQWASPCLHHCWVGGCAVAPAVSEAPFSLFASGYFMKTVCACVCMRVHAHVCKLGMKEDTRKWERQSISVPWKVCWETKSSQMTWWHPSLRWTHPQGQILVGEVGLAWQGTRSSGSGVSKLWPHFLPCAYPLWDPEQVSESFSFPICKMEHGMNTFIGLVW